MSRVIFENGWLLLHGDRIGGNEISIKPTDDLKKIWGRINEINYSVDANKITSIIVLCYQTDRLWRDDRLTQPLQRMTVNQYSAGVVQYRTVVLPLAAGYSDGSEIIIALNQIAYIRPHVVEVTPKTVPPTYKYSTAVHMINDAIYYVAKEWHEVAAMLSSKGWGDDLVRRYIWPRDVRNLPISSSSSSR